MKRLVVLLTAAAVAVTPAVAGAATRKAPPKPKPTTRTVVWSYSGTAGPTTPAASFKLCAPSGLSTCFDLPTMKHETKVSYVIKDASGQKVALQYAADGGYSAGATQACGAGTIDVLKGALLNFNTTADALCGAPATMGTVTFTITGKK